MVKKITQLIMNEIVEKQKNDVKINGPTPTIEMLDQHLDLNDTNTSLIYALFDTMSDTQKHFLYRCIIDEKKKVES